MSFPGPLIITCSHYHVGHRRASLVARDLGYFAEEGLPEVEITTTNHNEENFINALMEERVHFGQDAKPVETMRAVAERKAEIRFIAGWRCQAPWVVVGSKDMRSVEDIRGKRLGIRDYEGVDRIQYRLLFRKFGIREDEVEFVRGVHPAKESADFLRQGKIDVAVLNWILAPQMIAEGYPILARPVDDHPEGFPERSVVTTERMLRDHPEVVKGVLKGMIRGYRFLRDQPCNFQYVTQLENRLRATAEDPEERTIQHNFTAEEWAAFPLPPDGRFPVRGLEALIKVQIEDGRLPAGFSAEQVLRLEFLAVANAELDARPELQPELERVRSWVQYFGY